MEGDQGRVAKEIRARVDALNVWRRGGQRAPHKPLLLLLALGRLQRDEARLVRFADLWPDLERLLRDYGPSRSAYHPEYPFWRLRSDQLWELVGADSVRLRRSNTDPPKSELIKHDVRGGFPAAIHGILLQRPALVTELAHSLLARHFPDSVHEDLLDDVGLALRTMPARTRDPAFRREVLEAYERRCSICGFDARVLDGEFALEAAHIKWHQLGGPDIVQNGLALCSIHHKALDRGAIGLSDDLAVLISAQLEGSTLRPVFLAFQDTRIRMPQSDRLVPDPAFVRWHRKEVFRKPLRK